MARLAVIALLAAALSACGAAPREPVAARASTHAATATERTTGGDTKPPLASTTNAGNDVPQLVAAPAAGFPDDLQRLATEFVRYASEEADDFPHAESLAFSLGGQVADTFDDVVAALPNREIWRVCPAGWVHYGGSECPVDLLGPITAAAANRSGLVAASRPGEVVCAPKRSGPPPGGRLVVIRPEPAWRTCASDFALVLAADERGRLTGIDLTLAEP